MIEITTNLFIDEKDLNYKFIRASGPGGQNINKVSTAVQLKFNIKRNLTLSKDIKTRLIRMAGRRISEDGFLMIEAKRYRNQERNRIDALNRLKNLILRSLKVPKKRFDTCPTKSSQIKRMDSKKKHSDLKKSRRKVKDFD